MRKKTKLIWLVVFFLGILAIIFGKLIFGRRTEEIATVPVAEGPFRVTLDAKGELKHCGLILLPARLLMLLLLKS